MRFTTFAVFLAYVVEAFVITGVKPGPTLARASATPTMIAPEMVTFNSFPMTSVVADNTLALASGGLIGFLFIFLVVGTVSITSSMRPMHASATLLNCATSQTLVRTCRRLSPTLAS